MLSHGQASVERGFSINSEIMEYNFTQKSIVPLRNIYDHIQTCGGILHVKMEQELKNAVKNSLQNSAVSRRGNRKKKGMRKNMKQTGLLVTRFPL